MTAVLTSQYLSLQHLKCLPAYQFSKLIKEFGSLSKVANSSDAELRASGLDNSQILAIRRAIEAGVDCKSSRIEKSLHWLNSAENHHLVCFEEKLYPPLLREIDRPPPLLFLVGDPTALITPQLAIVGSRNASAQGKQSAFWLAKELSSLGFCICSGLASGIDTQAHLGALSVDAKTVAIMGTGVDRIYPTTNRNTASKIKTRGALVSEFALGSPPIAIHFPRRNRIISGMSLGVIVIEAALKSGSLITARLAMEQNRNVFAIPGSIHNPLARGCHRLIREGAILVDSADSVVEEITSLLTFQLDNKEVDSSSMGPRRPTEDGPELDEAEKSVLAIIGYDECALDTVVLKTKKEAHYVTSLLTGLELKGLIVRRAGRFKLVTTGLQEAAD